LAGDVAGSNYTGRFAGKMIVIHNLMDEPAWPNHAVITVDWSKLPSAPDWTIGIDCGSTTPRCTAGSLVVRIPLV
jgi:hypothetical protein